MTRDDQPLFVPLRVVPTATGMAFEVVLGQGRVVRTAGVFRPGGAAATPRRSGGGAAMLSLPLPVRVYLCLEPTDMRPASTGCAASCASTSAPIRCRAICSCFAPNVAIA